ncbi:MAG: hypothetical protein WKF70_07805 [Chitinophagaceae bacterium]
MSTLSNEINRHAGEKILVSLIPNLVNFTVLKNPKKRKSPMALNKNIRAILKLPYLKYLLGKYLSSKPILPSVIKARSKSPKATMKPAIALGLNLCNPLELVGNTASYQILPPKAQ